ncbi:MAG: DUF896 domain-containing protein [Firmicutes bacterium]|nr:DUF896 domain-containing protein [Bacillota bacterium]
MNENEEHSLISRINELAKKARAGELTHEEQAERDILRKKYIESFKNNLRSQLDSIVVVENDGSKTHLKKKK